MFQNKKILITGGTGSWAKELVSQLLNTFSNVAEIRIYSRGEHKQVELKRFFKNSPKLKFIIGDVRDKNILSFAMKDIHTVFHLAALKHVPVCEENPWEAVLTNIYGTQNIIECAVANSVSQVVDISTDKAVEPFNLYGVTKSCGEKLIVNANQYYKSTKPSTKFFCIRGGNVLGTNGSVIPLFIEQIRSKNEITVTDGSMTRFLMSTKSAIELIFQAVRISQGGEIFVMKMPAASVSTIAASMKELFGNKKTRIKYIGRRPGEKIHEMLISSNEVERTYENSKNFYVILPQIKNDALEKKYRKSQHVRFQYFSSDTTHMLTVNELNSMINVESYNWTN